ncbi:MAG: hypothetical protein L6Q71_11580, partial [Planctomycetes bacterium]|nr:hypothetical protein [Planctomycetota bacterium]
MFSLGGVVAQNSLQPDPNQQNPDAWIDDLKKNTQELPEQDLARAQALIKQLGSSVYREREQATRELLLLPRRVVAHLADHRKHASPEVRHRASWVVEQFRISG